MSRLRLLDTFCKAGGTTKGYQQAGFYVVGVDIEPQPHYCGDEFYQADALEFIAAHGGEFDAIHASPPCQGYSRTRGIPNRHPELYPRLIEPLRTMLEGIGSPYVIENPPPAPLRSPLMLCGTMFGLRTIRHRLFESNVPLGGQPSKCNHHLYRCSKLPGQGHTLNIYIGDEDINRFVIVSGHLFSLGAGRAALGISWMNRAELAQAIPPVFTELVGKALMACLVTTQKDS